MIPAQKAFQPESLETAGARLRIGCFAADPAAAPRGVCVLLNGQTEFIEKYFEVIDELRGRGFAVAAMDWRGQGGSTRLLPQKPLAVHIRDFAQYDGDLGAFMDRVVAPMLEPGRRPIALCHSMGGAVLLGYLKRHPERFAAAAFSAPMVEFSTREQPRWLVRTVTAIMMLAGRSRDFVWGISVRDPLTMTFERQMVTSDPVRFQRSKDFLARHPDLRTAGPTWGWVAAAYKALARFAASGFAETISTPALICAAGRDRLVVSEATQRFTARLPNGVYRMIEGAEHEILMERDGFRAQFWQAFDAFMDGRA